MRTQFIEVSNTTAAKVETGRYMVGEWIGHELARPSKMAEEEGLQVDLLHLCNWLRGDLLVVDLLTGVGFRFRPSDAINAINPEYKPKQLSEMFLIWLAAQKVEDDLPVILKFTDGKDPQPVYGYKNTTASKGGKYGIHRREVKVGTFYAAKTRGKTPTMLKHAARSDDWRALCGKMVLPPTPESDLFDNDDPEACQSCVKAVNAVMAGRMIR